MRLQPLTPKLLYFALFFAFGLCGPFYPLLLRNLIGDQLMGITLGVMQLVWVVMPPLWGMLADYTQVSGVWRGRGLARTTDGFS